MLLIFISILQIVGCIIAGNIMNDSELRGMAIWGFYPLAGAIAQYRRNHGKR